MSNLESYLDMLMTNHPLGTDSSSDDYKTIQKGGEKATDIPTGGFPPIFVCSRKDIEKEEEKKNREFTAKRTAVSIKNIMEKRREATPFIDIKS